MRLKTGLTGLLMASVIITQIVSAETYSASSATALKNILTYAKGGDVITLSSGSYGSVNILDYTPGEDKNGALVTHHLQIRPAEGADVTLDTLCVKRSKFIEFSGLTVIPTGSTNASACSTWPQPAVVAFQNASHIVFENSSVKSIDTITDDQKKDPEFWLANTNLAVQIEGSSLVDLTDNQISNIKGGIRISNSVNINVLGNAVSENAGSAVALDHANYKIKIKDNIFNNFFGHGTQDETYYSYAIVNNAPGAIASHISVSSNIIFSTDSESMSQANAGMAGVMISWYGLLNHWAIEKNIFMSGSRDSITLNDTQNLTFENNLEVDITESRNAFGLKLGQTSLTNNLTQEELNQTVSCNLMSGLSAPLATQSHNKTMTLGMDWSAKAIDAWDPECNMHPDYKLSDNNL